MVPELAPHLPGLATLRAKPGEGEGMNPRQLLQPPSRRAGPRSRTLRDLVGRARERKREREEEQRDDATVGFHHRQANSPPHQPQSQP